MNDPVSEFVKVYDFTTRQTTKIPASELAAGMVRVQLSGTDEIVWVDGAQLKQGAHRHPPFSGGLREKIIYIRESLTDVYPMTYEAWEDGFRRDLHAEQEIDIWIHVCRVFGIFVEQHTPTPEERHEAFQVLVACLQSTPSTIFQTVAVRTLDRAIAQKLVDDYFAGSRDS